MNFRNCVRVTRWRTAAWEERVKKKLGKRNRVREVGINV